MEDHTESRSGDGEAVEVRRSARWLVFLVAILGVGILVAVALTRDPVQLDPDTPEGTVQEYLLAVNESRWEEAFAVLDEESFRGCDPADIAAANPQPFTATLESSEQGGFNTFVSVRMRFGDGGVLGSGWESWETFVLVSRDGFWWLVEDPWPYFRWSCEQA